MPTESIVVALRAAGQAAFKAAMESSASSVAKVGTAGTKAGDAMQKGGTKAAASSSKWKKAAKGVAALGGGLATLYAAKRGVQASVNSTMDLAKGTLAVQRATNLDTETASKWSEITRARGIDTLQFQRGLQTLSKQLEAARGGSETSLQSFKQLGVSMNTIRKGDVSGVILQASDALSQMRNPAEKAALVSKLFGRAGLKLAPMLYKGSQAIRDQMKLAERYGATLGSTEEAEAMIAKQREMQFAMDGLKVTVGTALIPVLTSLADIFSKVIGVMQPVLKNTDLLTVLIGALVASLLVYRGVVIASTIATLGLSALWLAIPLAIIAIGAALVYAYKKVGWFHNAVDAVWHWIKRNWPLLLPILLGPIGIAVGLIIKNWKKIRGAVAATIGWIKGAWSNATQWISNAWRNVVRAITSTPGKIKSAASGMFAGIANAFADAVNFIVRAWNSLSFRIPGFDPPGPGPKFGGVTLSVPHLGEVGHMAEGGIVRRPGWSMVGEQGPELMWSGQGAVVQPLPSSRIEVPVYLNGRQIALAVADETAARKARR